MLRVKVLVHQPRLEFPRQLRRLVLERVQPQHVEERDDEHQEEQDGDGRAPKRVGARVQVTVLVHHLEPAQLRQYLLPPQPCRPPRLAPLPLLPAQRQVLASAGVEPRHPVANHLPATSTSLPPHSPPSMPALQG